MLRRLRPILLLIAAGTILAWFSGNFFYDVLWAWLDSNNIEHARVIAYVLSHLGSFVALMLLCAISYFGTRHVVMQHGVAATAHQSSTSSDAKIPAALTTTVGDVDPYKVITVSDGHRRETVRAIIRSKETLYDCTIDLTITNPVADEKNSYHVARQCRIVRENDFPLDIAHIDVIDGARSPILLHEIVSQHLHTTELQKDNYTVRLAVFDSDGAALQTATYRLWVDQGTLRLTTLS